MPEEQYFSVGEVSDMFGVSKQTIRKWIRELALPVLDLEGSVGWRIPGSTVDLLKQRKAARWMLTQATAA